MIGGLLIEMETKKCIILLFLNYFWGRIICFTNQEFRNSKYTKVSTIKMHNLILCKIHCRVQSTTVTDIYSMGTDFC